MLLKKRLGRRCFHVNFAKLKALFYGIPPVAPSSDFKASGFIEEVMQMNLSLSYDLVYFRILGSSWHF